MNLLLLEEQQLQSDNCAMLSERQQNHVQNVLRAEDGTQLKVGLLNGSVGTALLHRQATHTSLRQVSFDYSAPPQLPVTVILALPRPQMIKRILQTIACMGVRKLVFIQTGKVEKSFWQSPSVTDSAIREQLILGLEQAGATQLPVIEKHTRLRPFVEDILPSMLQNTTALVAHPGNYPGCPQLGSDAPALVAIGPEGGFTENEVDWFHRAGFKPFQLGQRILKVETAVPVILARLYN